MLIPPYLNSGDTIGIVSPSGKIKREFILNASSVLKTWGYKVVIGDSAFKEHNYYAGTDEERAKDLQKMLDDDKIKAILCSRGGYGCIRIMKKLNFKRFKKNPKWIIGFSDISILHSHINSNLKISSIHGKMAINFPSNENIDLSTNLINNILKGQNYSYHSPDNSLNKFGTAKAKLVGGNLSVINCILSTKYDIDTDDKILLLEEVGENLHHIDRMMNHFEMTGKFKKIKAAIIGSFSETKDKAPGFGKNAYEIISEYLNKLNIPIAYNFDNGHISTNYPVILGAEHKLVVNKNGSTLELV
jgi:muramoyltetrapeptide carboxypeptidase